jgi:aspartate/methionine/tyrosine aminotransferase
MAGYRAAFAAGSSDLVKGLVNLRMHSGLNTPEPAQKAMIAALNDDTHVAAQKAIYRARREELLNAVKDYGFTVADSEAGLYLWATLGEDCWKTGERMADLGIVVVPGAFYVLGDSQYVRFSSTATDSDIAEGARRLRDALGFTK